MVIMYYFSGTGNAKNAAKWIVNKAWGNGLETQLTNIDRFKAINLLDVNDKILIDFCL